MCAAYGTPLTPKLTLVKHAFSNGTDCYCLCADAGRSPLGSLQQHQHAALQILVVAQVSQNSVPAPAVYTFQPQQCPLLRCKDTQHAYMTLSVYTGVALSTQ